MSAKAGAKLFVVLYFVLLIPALIMTGGTVLEPSAFAAVPIVATAEAIVFAMLYVTIFFGHHDAQHEAVASLKPVHAREPARHSIAHG